MKIAQLMLLGCICGLCACSPPPADTPLMKQSSVETTPSNQAVQVRPRIQVTRIGVFEDNIAYSDRRGIYIINDSKTGREFIGISGVGIAETGSHYVSTGKSGYMQPDER